MTMIVYMARSHYRSILYVGLPIEKAQNWVWIVYEWWCNLPKRSLVRWPYRISQSIGVKKTSAIKAYIMKANWNPMALPRGWISSSISHTIIWNTALQRTKEKNPYKMWRYHMFDARAEWCTKSHQCKTKRLTCEVKYLGPVIWTNYNWNLNYNTRYVHITCLRLLVKVKSMNGLYRLLKTNHEHTL
jgi:hypothetical protein